MAWHTSLLLCFKACGSQAMPAGQCFIWSYSVRPSTQPRALRFTKLYIPLPSPEHGEHRILGTDFLPYHHHPGFSLSSHTGLLASGGLRWSIASILCNHT
jgi:hypothetical protein